MVTRSRVARIGLFIAVAAFFVLETGKAEAHETNVHREITDRAIDYLIQQRPELKACGRPEVRSALKDGVTQEDAFVYFPLGNFLFHFYPRLNDTLIPAGGSPFLVASSCSSSDWGFSTPSLYCGAMVGSTFYPKQFNNDKYDLTVQKLAYRGPNKNDGLISLGHFLHLLQDLTQPAHVRNDAHPHLDSLFGITFAELGDPSKFEVLNSQRVANGLTIPLPDAGLLTFSDAQSAFTQLANQTAVNFYSEKNTNAPSDPSVPAGPFGTLGADGYVRDASGREIAYKDAVLSQLLRLV
jgi:hypothetical protein